jgi:hypothetical protein
MMPGTTITGMMLFEGMSARPRTLSAFGVSTVAIDQPPSGKGSIGGRGLVGSAISASAN